MENYINTGSYREGEPQKIIDLITGGNKNIGNIAQDFSVPEVDIYDVLLRQQEYTPAELAQYIATNAADQTEFGDYSEVDLIMRLLEEGKTSAEEVLAYYQNTDPAQFGDTTLEEVKEYFKQAGGTRELAQGGMLNGTTDGMADQIPATIGGTQPARLSDGEFVVPADVVSHLGNGNTDAGATQLYSMMDRVRKSAPVLLSKVLKLTLPNHFRLEETTMSLLGRSSSLSPYAGPYVTDMLAKGRALAEEPYNAYGGELVAGASPLQAQAFQGLAGLAVPQATMSGTFSGTPYTPPTSGSILNAGMPSQTPYGQGLLSQDQVSTFNERLRTDPSFAQSQGFTPTPAQDQGLGTGVMGAMGMQPQQPNMVQQYMNPYLESALAPQYAQAQKDFQRAQRDLQGRYSQAGAYGGSRQGVAEGELMSGALQNLSAITGRGYEQAF